MIFVNVDECPHSFIDSLLLIPSSESHAGAAEGSHGGKSLIRKKRNSAADGETTEAGHTCLTGFLVVLAGSATIQPKDDLQEKTTSDSPIAFFLIHPKIEALFGFG